MSVLSPAGCSPGPARTEFVGRNYHLLLFIYYYYHQLIELLHWHQKPQHFLCGFNYWLFLRRLQFSPPSLRSQLEISQLDYSKTSQTVQLVTSKTIKKILEDHLSFHCNGAGSFLAFSFCTCDFFSAPSHPSDWNNKVLLSAIPTTSMSASFATFRWVQSNFLVLDRTFVSSSIEEKTF